MCVCRRSETSFAALLGYFQQSAQDWPFRLQGPLRYAINCALKHIECFCIAPFSIITGRTGGHSGGKSTMPIGGGLDGGRIRTSGGEPPGGG
jgi:hypothetical protein